MAAGFDERLNQLILSLFSFNNSIALGFDDN